MEETISKDEKSTSQVSVSAKESEKRKAVNWINDFKSNTLTRIQKFETQLSSVTKERNKISRDLEKANAQLLELREARKSLTNETTTLRKTLETIQSEFKYSEEEKIDALDRVQLLEDKISSLEEHKRVLESDLKASRDTQLNSKESQEELRSKIRLLEDKIDWNEKFHQEDLTKINELQSKLDDITRTKEKLEIDLAKITKRLEDSELKNMNRSDKIKVLEEKIISFEIVKKDLSRTKKDQNDSLERIEVLEGQLQTTNSLKDALEMDMKSLLNDLDCEKNFAEEYKRRIADLESDLLNFETVKSQMAEERSMKEDAHKKIKRLENELDSEKALKESLNSELEVSLNTIETLEKEKEQMSTVSKEVTEKNLIIEELQAELNSIEEERTEALEKIQELNDQLDSTLVSKEEIEDELKQLKEAMDSISGALAETDGTPGVNYELSEE